MPPPGGTQQRNIFDQYGKHLAMPQNSNQPSTTLGLIANNLNSINTKNQILASIPLTKI